MPSILIQRPIIGNNSISETQGSLSKKEVLTDKNLWGEIKDLFSNHVRHLAEARTNDMLYAQTENGKIDAIKCFGSFIELRNLAGPAVKDNFEFEYAPSPDGLLSLKINFGHKAVEISVEADVTQQEELNNMIALHATNERGKDDIRVIESKTANVGTDSQLIIGDLGDDAFEVVQRPETAKVGADSQLVIGDVGDDAFEVIQRPETTKAGTNAQIANGAPSDDDFEITSENQKDSSRDQGSGGMAGAALISSKQHKYSGKVKEDISYIVANVNKVSYFSGFLAMANRFYNTRSLAFHTNCVPCANAVDLNLETLAKGHEEQNQVPKFYYTDKPVAAAMDYSEAVMLSSGESPVDILRRHVQPGERAIFTAPNGPHYSHCMNYLRQSDGREYVLDGQKGVIHDLQDEAVLRKFLAVYSRDGGIVSMKITGRAPER